jgi:cytochrome b involved in lipid metabolism
LSCNFSSIGASTLLDKTVEDMAEKAVSVEEIKKHASEQDCWIVVDDVVWDITEFIPSHPGGNESKRYLPVLDDDCEPCVGFLNKQRQLSQSFVENN